ncbi:MAG: hypothetical protein CL596_05870, partial [Alteromonas sp.]|nr:hypothetical protein [Alteromonas sp.]
EIYCDGIAELYGELEGNIFTSAFRFKNASTEYRNLLFNATIKSLEDPHHFFQLFSEEESTLENPCILKKL